MASTATTATASSLILPTAKASSFTSIAKPTSVFFAIHSSSSPLKLSCLQLSIPQLSSFSSRFVRRVSVSSDFDQEDGLMIDGDEDDDTEDGAGFSPPAALKLYVGNLPFTVDSAQLAGLFETAGNVEMVEVVYDKISGRSRGFAFVTMSTVEEAEAATRQFDGYELDGRALRVNEAGNPPPRDASPFTRARVGGGSGGGGGGGSEHRLYVGNLSWGVDNSSLEALFSQHGNVLEARVVYDRESGRSRGFGFVAFSSADDMNNALDSLDGADLDGRSIRVSVAEARPRRF